MEALSQLSQRTSTEKPDDLSPRELAIWIGIACVVFAIIVWSGIVKQRHRRAELKRAAQSRWATWADEPNPPIPTQGETRAAAREGLSMNPRLSQAEEEQYQAEKREAVKQRKEEERAQRVREFRGEG